jgi:hypothetical protein
MRYVGQPSLDRRDLDGRHHPGIVKLVGQSLEAVPRGETLEVGQYVEHPVVRHVSLSSR